MCKVSLIVNMHANVLSHSVVSNSFRPHGLWPARLLCPRDSPGKNTGVGCHFLLQGIFPTHRLNQGLLHCRQILYHLSHQGSPRILKWIAYLFTRGSSQPRNRTRVSYIAGRFFASYMYTYIPSLLSLTPTLPSHPSGVIAEHQAELPVLYSMFSLAVYFTHGIVCICQS